MHNFTQQNHSLLSIFSTIALLLYGANAPASNWLDDWNFKGHIKYQLGFTDYDSNSLSNQMGYGDTTDQDVDLRLNVENRWDQWDVKVHYQIIGVYSDSLEASRGLPDSPIFSAQGIPSDDTRLFDLTHVFTDSGKEALLHRLDRASVGYTSGPFVIRFGRDAVSWGNGYDLYNAFRRTGYPNTLQIPILTPRDFPLRLPYPQEELTLNPNAASKRDVIYDRDPIFWDKN